MEGGKEIAREGEKEKLPDNVVIVERPEARFRLIYEAHNVPHNPEVIGSADVLAVEYIANKSYDNTENAEFIADSFWNEQVLVENTLKLDTRLRDVVQAKRLPMYLVDVADPKGEVLKKGGFTEGQLKVIETLVGVGLMGKAALDTAHKGREMSRRDFLKVVGQGAAGAYFGFNVLDLLAAYFQDSEKHHPKESSTLRKVERIAGRGEAVLHPEIVAVFRTLRNAIFAQKLETIARVFGKEIKRKPEIALIVGGGHYGIEEMFEVPPEKRAKTIVRVVEGFGLSKIKEQIPTIAELRFEPKERRWKTTKIFKDPMLDREVAKK